MSEDLLTYMERPAATAGALTDARVQRIVESLRLGGRQMHAAIGGQSCAYALGWVQSELISVVRDFAGPRAAAEVIAALNEWRQA